MPPTSIDGTDITGATIDGTDVQEITVDGQTVFTAGPVVPQTGLLHNWDWSAASTTTSLVEDQEGTADLTGSYDGFGTINGIQAGDYQGSFSETSGIQSFNSNRLIATVFQADPNAANTQFIWSDDANSVFHYESGGNYRFQQPSLIQSGGANSDPHISLVLIDSTDVIRLDGTQIASGNAGSDTMSELNVGTGGSGGSPLLGQIGEILMYDLSVANIGLIESYLSDKWGITI